MKANHLRLRRKIKRKKPAFIRQEGSKHVKLGTSWRRPRGKHSKLRRQKKARGRHPGPGYGSPRSVRGLTRSGLEAVRIFRPSDLDGMNPKTEGALIAGSVGRAKREAIASKAKEMGIKLLN